MPKHATLGVDGKVPAGQLPPSGAGPGGAEAFPVGSVFLSVLATDPSVLLGYGTWSAIGAGKVLIGLDVGDPDFSSLEKTGGPKTVASAGSISAPTFTGSALSTHTHGPGTIVPSAHAGSAVGDHAAHTHSVTSNVTVADHASHTHTYTQVPNHAHVERAQGGTTASTTGTHLMTSAATGGTLRSSAASTLDPTGASNPGTTAGPVAALTHAPTNNAVTSGNPSATLTHSVTQPSAHTMSGSSEAVTAGTPAGSVSAPTFTGSATSVVQPYLVVNMWKRTA